jgi:hypothetical protein
MGPVLLAKVILGGLGRIETGGEYQIGQEELAGKAGLGFYRIQEGRPPSQVVQGSVLQGTAPSVLGAEP